MPGLFGYLAAGAAQSVGNNMVEQAKAQREAGLKRMELLEAREFSTSERVAGEQFEAKQTELTRISDEDKNRVKLEMEAIKESQKAPEVETFYDENTGEPYNAEWKNGTWEKIGGSKAPSEGITITSPDGTRTQFGGKKGGDTSKVPTGYRVDPNDPDKLQAIPGGPAELIPSELAGRIALADTFLQNAPSLRKKVANGEVTGLIDFASTGLSKSDASDTYQLIESGQDSLLRMLTGAGMPESETASYKRRYLPGLTDDAESATRKLDRLTKELTRVREVVLRGRGTLDEMVKVLDTDDSEEEPETTVKIGTTSTSNGVEFKRKTPASVEEPVWSFTP